MSTEVSTKQRSNAGFWVSMAVLAAFGAIIAFGFAVAYFLV